MDLLHQEPLSLPPTSKPKRSLRTILILCFLLVSLVPLAFVTFFSVIKYEQAIDNELTQRLLANGREVSTTLEDYKASLQQMRDRRSDDVDFVYYLSNADLAGLKKVAGEWLRAGAANSLTFYNKSGRMLLSIQKDLRDITPLAGGALALSDENKEKIKAEGEYSFVEHAKEGKFSLILLSRINNASGRQIGYLQQTVDLDSVFLGKLKEKMKLELIILRSNGVVSAATLPDFALYKKGFFEPYTKALVTSFFDLVVRGEPHGFLVYPISWGNSDFFVALGASKSQAKAVLQNVNLAFFSVVAGIMGFLFLAVWLGSNALLKPLLDLVHATRSMQMGDAPIEIPITSDTEIGLLTDSFNQMSRNVTKTRAELNNKIQELEKANMEIQDTQTRLVHNSKMISLGQLVAGVAHELNNPIGFIYSNMSHLKEYADKLIQYAEEVEKNPKNAPEIKARLDLDYIKKDLPKLVASCEDGARRTRDIVLGLRNFSRLEAAQLKEIDLHEALDSTLNLLQGEIKSRIEIIKDYGDLPRLTCLASQINQVFMNILSNALQAIKGPGKLWLTTKIVQQRGRPDMISIHIQDSGKGISPDDIEKIFDPFFSTKEVGQGTGLGLSITYSIVQSHGGDIQVKSQVGTGTEFTILLPVVIDAEFLKGN